jgi:hypothetical protein
MRKIGSCSGGGNRRGAQSKFDGGEPFDQNHRPSTRRATVLTEKQAAAIESSLPRARVVRVPDASHLLFESHEMLVSREIRNFVASLK